MTADVAAPVIVYVHLKQLTTITIYALKMLLIIGIPVIFKPDAALDIPMKIITENAGVMIVLLQRCVCPLKSRLYGPALLGLYSMTVSTRSGQRSVIIYANNL
jgi:hypothetical protein